MKSVLLGASALALSVGAAHAAGLDRSGQSVMAIFADDNTANLSFGYVMPSVTGKDDLGNDYDVGDAYSVIGLSYTNAINEQISYSVIFDQPYGANVTYNNSPLTSALGGTGADLSSEALTFVGKYQISDRISVFGGIKLEQVRADVALNGIAYRNAISTSAVTRGFNATRPGGTPALDASLLGAAAAGSVPAATAIDTTYGAGTTAALGGQIATQAGSFAANDGYKFSMDTDRRIGYVIGAAYEIPEIAFRLALTYSPEIEHKADTTEDIFGATVTGDVEYVTPQSVNIEFQTGIAPDTLLLATYRWTEFSAVDVVPTALGSDLVNLNDGERYTLGIGRRFNPNLSGSAVISYEPEGDELVSPLGPTNGLWGLSIGGQYTKDNVKLSGGINYSWLGNAKPEVGGVAAADFENNHSVAFGIRAEFAF
ncbi:hypothetical protein KUH32_15115 [Thalassococcus sp. CAU 1522]|uniref:Long-chain fatty acid transport protein n=1 Tax=Thalassococcus arenae TaxID=2851652 RepID=A0ABS6NAP7_9RHOB|nr:hypothetical protein [Thalassococcus arenae]MBV2361094.1 hypothetical protein [Thalassococcus arenae]